MGVEIVGIECGDRVRGSVSEAAKREVGVEVGAREQTKKRVGKHVCA